MVLKDNIYTLLKDNIQTLLKDNIYTLSYKFTNKSLKT